MIQLTPAREILEWTADGAFVFWPDICIERVSSVGRYVLLRHVASRSLSRRQAASFLCSGGPGANPPKLNAGAAFIALYQGANGKPCHCFFLYRCPNTRLNVQGWSADDAPPGEGDADLPRLRAHPSRQPGERESLRGSTET
jgi:hypothetical protein